jgi:hypothetical protein
MIHDLQYFPILDLTGRPIYVFKVPRGSLGGNWEAADIVIRAEGSLRGGDYVPGVIVMEGEPNDDPHLFGPQKLVSYVRSVLRTLGECDWHRAVID